MSELLSHYINHTKHVVKADGLIIVARPLKLDQQFTIMIQYEF